MIKQESGKWVLYDHTGAEVLGRYDTREEAVAQGEATRKQMMQSYATASRSGPALMRVVKVHADGSGVVEVPVLRVGEINLDLASSGSGRWDVTRDTLAEIAGNLQRYEVPIPIGIHPHKPAAESGGPMPGFLEGLDVRGDTLWGRFSVTAALMTELRPMPAASVGTLRGFSGEFAKNIRWPWGKVGGWSMYGGVFTNRPAAAGAHFQQVAASAAVSLSVGLWGQEDERSRIMPELQQDDRIALSVHEKVRFDLTAQLATANGSIQTLSDRLESARAELSTEREKTRAEADKRADGETRVIALTTERDTAKAQVVALESGIKEQRQAVQEQNKKIVELTDKLTAEQSVNLSARVGAAIDKALAAGVAPAIFDGHAGNEAAWMTSRYANVEAFETMCETLAGAPAKVPDRKPVKSGHEPSNPSDGDAVLTSDEAAAFKRLNLGTEFIGVTTEEEARERFEKRKAAQATK